jgi:hypothetical protein
MRRRGDQKNLAVWIASKIAEQFEPLMLGTRSRATRPCRRMRLIHNHEIGRVREKSVPLRFRFHEIDARDEVRIMLVDRDVGSRQIPFQTADLRWLNEHRLDHEFLAQRAFPLVAEMRRTEDSEPTGEPPIEQFARDHRRLDRLADADIVRDQRAHRRLPQGHDQRHELITN